MAIVPVAPIELPRFTTTRAAAQLRGYKVLVYSQAGVGKTTLCRTAPRPLIISAEGGMLSLRSVDIVCIEITTLSDLVNAYNWISRAPEARRDFSTICIDSLSEIAEKVLSNAKASVKDPRQAYGELIDKMEMTIRMFRDLPFNVYMSAKMEPMKDEISGAVKFAPAMPGSKLAAKLPYFFDEVFRLGIGKNADNSLYRFLQTQPDLQYEAKDRSGALAPIEVPDLNYVFNKIAATA